MSRPRDHYSYSVYADPATARRFDEGRFGGPIGRLVADDQARALLEFVGPVAGRRVLDVGTGTGRAAILLTGRGGHVIGVDPSPEMLAVARRRASEEQVQITFVPGDAHDLQFRTRAFDVVVCLRVLMHAARWRRCLAELCRVADRRVIIDYPSATSLALVQSVGRRLVHAIGVRTEPYRVLGHRTVARELAKAGFQVRGVHRQFVLPIALHKAIGSERLSASSRALSHRLGLLRLMGTPITVVAERCAS